MITITCHHCNTTQPYTGKNRYTNCHKCGYKIFLNENDKGLDPTKIAQGLSCLNIKLETKNDRIRLIPWGDVHVGAPQDQCDWNKAQRELDYILETDDTYMIGMGDLMDCAMKMPWAKGPNIFSSSMMPMEQFTVMEQALKPLAEKNKIIGLLAVTGDTIVLTEYGWSTLAELTIGQKILSLNLDNDQLEYSTIKNIYPKYNYEGEVIHITSESQDQLLTPDHRVLLKDRYNRVKYIHASELPDRFKIFTNGIYEGQNIYPEDYIKLIAWIITEGTYQNNGGIQIYQTKPEGVTEIKQCLDNLNYAYSIYVSPQRGNIKPNTIFYIKIKDANPIRKLLGNGKDTQVIPKEFLSLKSQLAKLFLNTLMKGDGCRITYYTSKKELAYQVLELALKQGRRAHISYRRRNNKYDCYAVHMKNSKYSNIVEKQGNLEKQQYKGIVYCLETTLGNFVACRNGKPFITGNSGNHEEWIMQTTGIQIIDLLCRSLKVPYLGMACDINIQVNKQKYALYALHGSGNAQMSHTKMGRLRSCTKDIFADVFLMGHTHQISADKGGKRVKAQNAKAYYVLCGHFLNWTGSYSQAFGMDLSPAGTVKISMFSERKDVHISL